MKQQKRAKEMYKPVISTLIFLEIKIKKFF